MLVAALLFAVLFYYLSRLYFVSETMEMDMPNTPTSTSRVNRGGLQNEGSSPFVVPPTPVLKTIGYGAGKYDYTMYYHSRSLVPADGLCRSLGY